jgi:hypothetical protein
MHTNDTVRLVSLPVSGGSGFASDNARRVDFR